MYNILKLIRVKHYLKNFLIFLPLFFSGNINNVSKFLTTSFAFISFSFVCSIVYIINDIKDVEKDKLHPTKKNRPIASGKISIKSAIGIACILMLLAILFFFLSNSSMINCLYLVIYLLLNIFYSCRLKNIPLLDIAILSSGFLIRILFGGAVIDVEISNWLFLTVMSISLYLVIGKRRNEIINVSKKLNTRTVLKHYTQSFLDKNLYMCLSLGIIFYSLWTMDFTNTKLMIWTVPLVILICMKYNLNIEIGGDADPIEVVYKDKILILMLVGYVILLITGIYII